VALSTFKMGHSHPRPLSFFTHAMKYHSVQSKYHHANGWLKPVETTTTAVSACQYRELSCCLIKLDREIHVVRQQEKEKGSQGATKIINIYITHSRKDKRVLSAASDRGKIGACLPSGCACVQERH